MNTQKKLKISALGSRMVFRLWSIMMLLVLLAIGMPLAKKMLAQDAAVAEKAALEAEGE